MKSIVEIQKQINFPKFNDMFGNEIKPGDIIGMTNTGSRQIYAYFVTNVTTTSKNVVLLDITHENYRSYLNINELNKKTSKHYQALNIVKLTDSLPLHLKDKALQLKENFLKNKEKQAAARKNVAQSRFFPVFAYDKKNKQLGVIFMPIFSQPGKVISAKDIQAAYADLNNRFPNYILNIIDKDGSLNKLEKRVKSELFSFNRSMYHYGKGDGFFFSMSHFADSWKINAKYDYSDINKFIKISKNETGPDDRYGIIADNYQNYYIENFDNNRHNKYNWINLKYCFSQAIIDKLEAFEKYYA